jgi:hypothetical protein
MKKYRHPDGREIHIFATYKQRFNYPGNGRLDPNTRRETTWEPFTDQWPTLQRATVPNLTDEEWTASPGPDWQDITEQPISAS